MWNKIVEELKKTDNNEINTFIDAFSPKEETREKIIINCKSKYAYDFLKKNSYLSKIEKTAKTLFDENTKVQFIVIPEEEKSQKEQLWISPRGSPKLLFLF